MARFRQGITWTRRHYLFSRQQIGHRRTGSFQERALRIRRKEQIPVYRGLSQEWKQHSLAFQKDLRKADRGQAKKSFFWSTILDRSW